MAHSGFSRLMLIAARICMVTNELFIYLFKPQEEKPTWIIILYWPYSPAS